MKNIDLEKIRTGSVLKELSKYSGSWKIDCLPN
jgi:hypothetical protein